MVENNIQRLRHRFIVTIVEGNRVSADRIDESFEDWLMARRSEIVRATFPLPAVPMRRSATIDLMTLAGLTSWCAVSHSMTKVDGACSEYLSTHGAQIIEDR